MIQSDRTDILCCPVCGGDVFIKGNSLVCGYGHSYDISREGYVNLLRSNQSARGRHGDDKLMLTARAEFLGKGHYQPICDALLEMILPYTSKAAEFSGDPGDKDETAVAGTTVKNIIDCGCGDGWYSQQLIERNADNGVFPDHIGIDISKTAVKMAAKRHTGMLPVVASAFNMPVKSGSADMLLSIFAPIASDEFRRVLRYGGSLFTVTACERHLYGLKKAIYDRPYENECGSSEIAGFRLEERRRVEYMLSLEGEDIKRLFMMTPYYYKTSRADQEKLDSIVFLETEVSVEIRRCLRI